MTSASDAMTKHWTRTTTAAALSLAAAMAAGGAAGAETTPVKLALVTQPGIWDAGIFAAVDHKFFDEQKLAFSFVVASTPADGLKLLASGSVNFAIANSTEVLSARSRGVNVVSIATNHQFGMAGIMVPADSGITNLKQLEGKTLGITGIPFNRVMLEYCLKKANVDLSKVKIVIVGFAPMPLLLSKRIDGIGDAITWSEPAMYNVQIKKPVADTSTYKYWAFYQNGVPRYYTLGVVADEAELAKNPEMARRFLAAWTKGLDWAIKNQKAAIDELRKRYPTINEQEATVNLAEIARISQSPDTAKHGLGWQDPVVWAKLEEFMREQGLIPQKVDVAKAVNNSFLPQK